MERIAYLKDGVKYKAPQAEIVEFDQEFSTLLSVSLGFGFGDGFGDETPLF